MEGRKRMRKRKHPTSNIQRPTSNGERPQPAPNVQQAKLDEVTGNVWELRDGEAGRRRFDLEERLLEFASAVIDLSEKLPKTRAGTHVANQILRSGTSPYPNHGEAEAAESRDDFVHKLKICLKELRETRRWARLIKRKAWAADDPTLVFVLAEADELVRIFFASVQTARRNALAEKRSSAPVQCPSGVAGQPLGVGC
jgi:four helix bundle protein